MVSGKCVEPSSAAASAPEMRVYLLILLASAAHAVALPFLRPRAAPAVVRAGVRTPLLVCSADSVLTASGPESSGPGFQWTPLFVVKVGALFLASAVAEIGGGWLVWQAVRAGKPWWWALLGSAALVAYGFIPTLQPLSDFGRLYAVYGGIFIALSYVWGVRFDGMRVDRGDVIGSLMALAGVMIALFWPRGS